jgi:hypothetical protein
MEDREMNELMMAVRNGTMSAGQAAERALNENAYTILHMEYDGNELSLEWENGMAQGPNSAEFWARLAAWRSIQAEARTIDAQREQTIIVSATVRCSCGHSVPKIQVMNASNGTSCPDCYDRMSE